MIDLSNNVGLVLNKFILDSEQIEKIKKTKCKYDGVLYKKGDKIKPDGTCYECICDENFDSSSLDIFSPLCQRRACGFGISGEDHTYLNSGCVPVYDQTKTQCCPREWRCRKIDLFS